MISKLSIDNYALIEKSNIDFKKGFTVITGETGAGKSIMLDALGLLMGSRADSKVMRDKDKKMVVEAVFTDPDPSIEKICEEYGIEWDNQEMILRREISTSGKSRGFINDTPVNLTALSAISSRLLDIHSQHSNSLLNKSIEQMSIIDAFGKTNTLLENYQIAFREYVALRNRIKKIKESIIKGKENKEYIMFRLEQLDKLKPKKGELEALERESEILGDADRIKENLKEALNLLSGNNSALKFLQGAGGVIENIDFSLLDEPQKEDISERINFIKIELKDISDTLESYAEKINSDPERYEKIQSRIGALYEIMKRFKVKDENELVDLHKQLKEELSDITGENSDLEGLEKQLKELAKDLKDKAEMLSEARAKSAENFSKVIIEKIRPLGLPNINFKVDLQKGKLNSGGQDIVTFYCSFNKNHIMQPIAEIASGGEISRVMLGIKSIMAESMKLPTIIFDEVDTGVSGEIADKMGKMMKKMASSMQVMSVTHLPQVAANGDYHLKVYKDEENEKTISHIKELNEEERIIEIAGMLSGTTINEVALENARILLHTN